MSRNYALASEGLNMPYSFNARIYEGIHPKVAAWVASAPIIATITPLKPITAALEELAAHKGKMRDAFNVLGLPWALRHLDLDWVNGGILGMLSTLPYLKPETLALVRHRNATAFNAAFQLRPEQAPLADWVGWYIRVYAHRAENLGLIRDYIEAGNPVNWDWSIARFKKEHDKWVQKKLVEEADKLIKAARARGENAVDIGEDPERITIDGVMFLAVRTEAELLSEGKDLRHCVGSYWEQVKRGTSRIYRVISSEGRSTVEFRHGSIDSDTGLSRACINQHKAHRNASPPENHIQAAQKLAEQVHSCKAERRSRVDQVYVDYANQPEWERRLLRFESVRRARLEPDAAADTMTMIVDLVGGHRIAERIDPVQLEPAFLGGIHPRARELTISRAAEALAQRIHHWENTNHEYQQMREQGRERARRLRQQLVGQHRENLDALDYNIPNTWGDAGGLLGRDD